MTITESRLLVMQIVAWLAAIGGIFKWYDSYFEAFYKIHPILAPAIVAAGPLYILCSSIGPQMWRRYRQARRDSITLVENPEAERTKHFRLDPYITPMPQEFQREDDAHNEVLQWISETTRPVLFLSGVSGAGKS